MKNIGSVNNQNKTNSKTLWKYFLPLSIIVMTFFILNLVQGQQPANQQLGESTVKTEWKGVNRILRPSTEDTRILIGKELRPLNPLHIDGIFDVDLNKEENSGAIRISSGNNSLRLDENEIMAVQYFPATNEFLEQERAATLHINAEGGAVHFFKKQGRNDEIVLTPSQFRIGKSSDQLNSAKLVVGGTIGAKEIIVTPDNWADDVFQPNYVLRTLAELEDFLAQNKHLPGMPSEADVKSEGISITEFNTGMLRNLEELTLHVISQSKAIAAQRDSLAIQLLAQKENYELRIKKLEQFIQNQAQAEIDKL